MKEIIMPKLTDYQKDVWDWFNERGWRTGSIAVIKACRQVGKSIFCLLKLIDVSLSHNGVKSVIYEPTLNQARNLFKQLSKMLDGSNLIKINNAQLLEIELTNGSTILFKSTEQNSRGFTVTGILILDECAYLPDDDIYDILPLVQANNADMIVVSTPFTEDGYFYHMYCLGLEGTNPNVKLFDWTENKEISKFLTDEKKAFYKQTMSPQKYRTEIEGKFLSNDGLLFVGLDKCILPNSYAATKDIYVGIDFASGNNGDYTVLIAVDSNGRMICMHRTNNLSPLEQVDWLCGILIDLSHTHRIVKAFGEKNSLGVVYLDNLNSKLKNYNIYVSDWVTTNKSKQDLITTLQIAFENGRIGILDNPILLNELKRFQATINAKTKTISYAGCNNSHDDTVMALAFAYYAYTNSLGNFTISFV